MKKYGSSGQATDVNVIGRREDTILMPHNKTILCITHTVEHNYISHSSTVGIQLHVSALYVGHLLVVI